MNQNPSSISENHFFTLLLAGVVVPSLSNEETVAVMPVPEDHAPMFLQVLTAGTVEDHRDSEDYMLARVMIECWGEAYLWVECVRCAMRFESQEAAEKYYKDRTGGTQETHPLKSVVCRVIEVTRDLPVAGHC